MINLYQLKLLYYFNGLKSNNSRHRNYKCPPPSFAFSTLNPIEFPNGHVTIPCKSQAGEKGVTSDEEYKIVSYINHLGESPTAGHYISYVKSAKENNWYLCNDKEVDHKFDIENTLIWNQKYKTSETAYIVVLKKKV